MLIIQFQVKIISKNTYKFIWKRKLYQFGMLPNGLSLCLRWFTKMLKPFLEELRELKHNTSACINDTFLQAIAEIKCIKNIYDTILF